MSIHKNYLELSRDELTFVDIAIDDMMKLAKAYEINLRGDDTVERVVEALATAVVKSRQYSEQN